MTNEDKEILLMLLQRYKELGISEQIDYEKFYLCMAKLHCQHLRSDIDQFINSVAEGVVDKETLRKEMVDKWSLKPSLSEKLVDIVAFMADKEEISTEMVVKQFGYPETSAKRYLRQLTQFGYLGAKGGNKNRTYSLKRM